MRWRARARRRCAASVVPAAGHHDHGRASTSWRSERLWRTFRDKHRRPARTIETGDTMPKIKHIAISTQDVEKTAKFYIEVFGMKEIARVDSPGATGYYLSDGDLDRKSTRLNSSHTVISTLSLHDLFRSFGVPFETSTGDRHAPSRQETPCRRSSTSPSRPRTWRRPRSSTSRCSA